MLLICTQAPWSRATATCNGGDPESKSPPPGTLCPVPLRATDASTQAKIPTQSVIRYYRFGGGCYYRLWGIHTRIWDEIATTPQGTYFRGPLCHVQQLQNRWNHCVCCRDGGASQNVNPQGSQDSVQQQSDYKWVSQYQGCQCGHAESRFLGRCFALLVCWRQRSNFWCLVVFVTLSFDKEFLFWVAPSQFYLVEFLGLRQDFILEDLQLPVGLHSEPLSGFASIVIHAILEL
jgi:hypothetical protein